MSLQDIYDELNAALHDGVITLSGSTVGGLDLTLEAIGITATATLGLTGATLSLGPRSVVLTGTASYRSFNWSATLTGESLAPDDASKNRFTLTMQGLDGDQAWTFGTSFQSLPRSRLISDKGTLPLTDSIIARLVVTTPVISVTTQPPRPARPFLPRLQGWLVVTGSPLSPYMAYFAAPRLRLDGNVDFADPLVPVITAWASAPNAVRNLPIIPVSEVGIRLQSNYPDIFALEDDAVVSAAAVYAKITVGKGQQIHAEISTPLLQGDFVWPLSVNFSEPITASTGLALVREFFGQPSDNTDLFSFPLASDAFRNFGLSGVEVGIQPPLGGRSLDLVYASMQFRSVESWHPTLAFVTIKELGAGWTYHWYGSTQFVTGNVWGKLTFFDDPMLDVPALDGGCVSNKIELLVEATIPDFQITGSTEGDICVPVGRVLKKYLGGSGGLSDDLRITRIVLQALPLQQTYQASMMVEGIWSTTINRVKFSLDRIIGELMVTQNRVFGSLTGWTSILVTDGGVETTKATFVASAEYRQDGTWNFEGGLAEGELNVIDFAFGLLGVVPSVSLPAINLTELWLSYSTSVSGSANPYSARGTLEARWKPEVLGMTLSAVAKARVARRPKATASDTALALASPLRADGEMIYEGELSGTVKVNQLAVTVGLSFVDRETVYFFEVAFGKATVRAATEWVDDKKQLAGVTNSLRAFLDDPTKRHQIITITLRGFTLGDVVEYLVNLANPNVNYHLEAPWTFLNAIDLSRFEVRIDPKYQTVTLTYNVNLSLPFISLKSVGLLYDRSTGEGTVNFVLEGTFLGRTYDQKNGNPLTWEAVNEAPPSVPGKGAKLFELRYLGAGQHITLKNLTTFNSITEVLRELRNEMKPPKEVDKNPFSQSQIQFDASSQWMFGIDCTVMDTVSLGIVLHDPDLYGLVVSLAGPEAGSLAGLSFELLYKKVTDTVGVFRVRLQVPDMFRQINFGYVSVTLGVITVDIFTNGNFKVDLGFPHNRDFSLSFGLEAGPFIGSGGIYFGLLDGATSSRVPAITNGTFDPVLELGLGLAVGVGRTFNKGPLKAGLYVQLVAILEGVLGWFHPTDESAPKALYYWGQGSAGLIGKLYGTVDFKIIKVSVSVEAHAIVSITFAAHRETVVELDVGVEVSAEVTILFVSISFSFSLQLKASFTMGENTVTPWILADDQRGRMTGRLLDGGAPRWRRRPIHVRELTRQAYLRERLGRTRMRARLTGAEAASYELHWPATSVFPDGAVHPVMIKMLPAYTVDEVPVQWPDQDASLSPTTEYRICFMLMADNGVSPKATTIAETRALTAEHVSSATDTTDLSFNFVIEAMLRWSFAALGLDPVSGTISVGQLEELANQLDMARAASDLDMKTLGDFFLKNLEFRISGVPSGSAPSRSGGTAFPIPPPLGWDSQPTPPDPYQRRFANHQPIDATFEREVRQYFEKLDPDPDARQVASTAAVDDATESMATFVFRDYFLMIAKAAVQAAIQVMTSFPYDVTGESTESLASIAALFPDVTVQYAKRADDTVDQVAGFYGMSRSELLALNPELKSELDAARPSSELPVKLGVTPESIAAGNPSWPLTADKRIPLGDLVHQLNDGETLASIATKFGADVDAWLQDSRLLGQADLLAVGAPLDVPRSSFVNTRSLELALVAAFLYVRLHGTDSLGLMEKSDVPLVEWYVQAIAELNTIVSGVLPATVQVPKAFDNTTETVEWQTQPGDDVWRVAATFAVYQNQTGNTSFAQWLQQVTNLNPGGGPFARVILPETRTAILAGETLATLALRLPVELPASSPGMWLDAPASFRALVKGQRLLAPLTLVTVPGCEVTTVAGQTLATFAALYDVSLEDAGHRLAKVGGLLAKLKDHRLEIPHPAAANIGSATPTGADLVPTVIRDHASTIGGQASRFLVSGLRIPAPVLGGDGHYHATGQPTALYELIGQQLTGPNPPATCPPTTSTVRMSITVENHDSTATWVKLYDSTTLTGGEALSSGLHLLNPGLAKRDSVSGLVALTSPVEQLVFNITDEELCNHYPATTLRQVFTANPAARELYRDVPVRHGLQQRILWQTTETLVLPNPGHVMVPVNTMPSLWPFSSDLMAAALEFPSKSFALCTSDPQLGPSAAPSELSLYSWATVIDIRIRTIPGLPNTYEVFGANTADRQLLLELWKYLEPPQTDTATIHLLYQESVSAGLPNGLSSVPVSDATTYIVKTNLTTETRSGVIASQAALGVPPTFGDYYARLADARRFLTLMWECSVVGGGGYWLRYTASDGSPLPPSIFASDGTATVSLFITLAKQMDATAPERTLHSFNNCALVGDSLAPSASNLFARVGDFSETRREATVAPGNVAFYTKLDRPPKQTWPTIDKQIATRQLYSLLGYQLTEAPTFIGSAPSMPVGPKVPSKPLSPLEPAVDEAVWELFQVIPIWRYAKSYGLPDISGLPSPTLDPYAGINGATDKDGKPVMARTCVNLWFRDVLGNTSRSSGGPDSGGPDLIYVPVGYTDPVLGVGSWPATTGFFHVGKPGPGSGASLMATISLQASTHLPATQQRASNAVKTASDHLARFTRVYYQVMQPDVHVRLLSTLETVNGAPVALETTGSLASFTMAACGWLSTAAKLLDVYVDTTLAGTLEEVSRKYGVGYDGLAAANGSVPLSHIFPTPLSSPVVGTDFTLPVYAVFKKDDTVAVIAAARGVEPVAVLKSDENSSLPLQTGIELSIPAHDYSVPLDDSSTAPPTLTEIARDNDITLASLVKKNESSPALLRVGFVFVCDGVEVEVHGEEPDILLDDVAATFQSNGVQVDAVMVAGANADKPGMFRPGAKLSIDRYLVVEGETLAHNHSGSTLDILAPLNTGTASLFFAGTALYLEAVSAGASFDESITDVASTFGISAAQLLSHNRKVTLSRIPTPLSDASYLSVPGHAQLPAAEQQASLRIPYAIPTDATLEGIAALFLNADPTQASGALALALANEWMPGVLAGSKVISAGGQDVTARPGESLGSLLSRFNPAVPLSDVVTFIQGKSGYLNAGGLLLPPPAKLPSTKSAYTPREVATLYGVSVSDIANANSGLSGIVASGVTLTSPLGGTEPPTVTTGVADSFVSFVWRFSQAGVQTTVADVITTNADAPLLSGGAVLLLPPPPAVLSAPFGTSGWKFPSTIFDIHAWVELSRNSHLVDENFRGTSDAPGAAVRDRTSLPPVPRNHGGTGAEQYLALQNFAKELEQAVPLLRTATGKVLSEQREASPSDIFGVAFGAGYIDKVAVRPGVTVGTASIPQYFALRPLENALVTRTGVGIQPLQADGILGSAVPTNFQGVDLETWAQRFLADVDLFVSAPYAAAAYQTSKRQVLEKVLAAKQTLAASIAKGLDYILDLGQPDPSRQESPPADWVSACESLRQRLLVGLVAGYGIDALVQYQSQVTSPWSDEYARLSGPGKLVDGPERGALRTTLSSAKVSLATSSSSSPGYLNFLLDVSEEGRGRTIDLALGYPINEIEFRIEEIADGYDASDWLGFIRPFTENLPSVVSFDFGSPSVPLPVRAYPPLPSLLTQTAQATHSRPSDYTHAMHWDYAFTYQHQSMAVDQIRLEIEFNQAPLESGRLAATEESLFEKLAQYNAVAPALWTLLKGLPDYEKVADKTQLENAMETFQGLVQGVSDAWSVHWTSGQRQRLRRMSAGGPQPELYQFEQTADVSHDEVTGKWFYLSLYLKRVKASGSLDWPVMGVIIDGKVASMGSGVDTPRGRKYDFPAEVEAYTLLAYEMRFSELHIATYQNASSQVQVVRNAFLSELAPTRKPFVYQTQSFAFPEPITPLLSWREPFPIGKWSWNVADNPLAAVFTSMFDGSVMNRSINCGIRYGYTLATSSTGSIVPYLPVKYRPKFTYVDGVTGTLKDIIDAVQSWNDREKPMTTGGEWLVSFSLFSSIDGQLERPLLELPVLSTLT